MKKKARFRKPLEVQVRASLGSVRDRLRDGSCSPGNPPSSKLLFSTQSTRPHGHTPRPFNHACTHLPFPPLCPNLESRQSLINLNYPQIYFVSSLCALLLFLAPLSPAGTCPLPAVLDKSPPAESEVRSVASSEHAGGVSLSHASLS